MTDADPSSALDLFARQRACRSFRPDDVPDELVEAVLEAATRAPSAQNLQPWVFVVVRDLETRAAVWEVGLRLWDAGGREASAAVDPPALHASVDAALAEGGFAFAPVTIVVGADADRCPLGSVESSIWPATQNLLLAATALGLGSALTTIATFFAAELRAVVGLPDHITPVAVVPLGYPATPLGPNRREPVADHTHREQYGTPW
jgi:nitroreductase